MKYQNYTVSELQTARVSIMQRVDRFNAYVNTLSQIPTCREVIELKMRLEIIEPLYKEFDEVVTSLEKAGQHNLRPNFEAAYFKSVAAAKDILEARGKY